MMLILNNADGSAAEYVLEEKNLLGRSPESTVQLTDDDQISRKHAVIVKKDGYFWFKDLGSNNGSFLNGERVTAPVRIKDKDLLVLGKTSFTVCQGAASKDVDGEETVFAGDSQGSLQQQVDELNEETQFMSPDSLSGLYSETPAELHVVKGPMVGEIFSLHRSEIYIGRTPNNDFCVSCPSVSTRHTVISQQEQKYTIKDLGSTNGTFLNKKKLMSEQQLVSGDIIQVGDVTLRFVDNLGEGSTPAGGKSLFKGAFIFALIVVATCSAAYIFWPNLQKILTTANKQQVEQPTAVPHLESKAIKIAPQKKTVAQKPVEKPVAKQNPIITPQKPDQAALQKKAGFLLSEAMDMYMQGEIENAINLLGRIGAMELDSHAAILQHAQNLLAKMQECLMLYNNGQQYFLSGQMDEAVKMWDRLFELEATIVKSTDVGKSFFTRNISRVMAEELYLQAVEMVKENNLIMARQYCVEVVKSIADHQGCSAIIKDTGAE